MALAIVEEVIKDKTSVTSTFLKPPAETRLDKLSSFAAFGMDIKITPENEVKVIETDCLKFGMAGFEKAGVLDNGVPPRLKLKRHLQSYGLEQISYIREGLINMGQSPLWLEKYVHVPKKTHIEWGIKYRVFVDTLSAIQGILDDKVISDCFFEDLREHKPKTRLFNEQGLLDLINENPEYAVIKPKRGTYGNDVTIARLEDIAKKTEIFEFGYALEPFVISKPIYSEKTGQNHDGCMRYVILIEQEKQGQLMLVYHFGGYWRLCPKPISEYGTLDAMRANLCKKAIPEKASQEDLNLVRLTIKGFMPKVYRDFIRCVNV